MTTARHDLPRHGVKAIRTPMSQPEAGENLLSFGYWKNCLTSQVRSDDPTKASLRTIVRWRWRRYYDQYVATFAWHANKHHIQNEECRRIVAELRENGIATSSVESLGLNPSLVKLLWKSCAELAESPHALEIGEDRHDNVSGARKTFFYRLLGHDTLRVDEPDLYCRIALDPAILEIANSYLRCYSRLTRYNVWLNLPSSGDPVTSQLWHRDYGDTSMLKMFMLVEPVTVENGAFSYIPGTQQGGRRQNLNPAVVHETGMRQRTLDNQMRAVVPERDWITPTGDAGTVIFADTSGFHKGGFVKSGRRLLFKTYYTRWVGMVGRTVDIRDLGDLDSAAARWATKRPASPSEKLLN